MWILLVDGRIEGKSTYKVADEWEYTDREVIHGFGGGLYYKGEEPPPPPPTLEEARTAKLAEINAGYSAVMGFIQGGYPQEEVLSWERQATQARELLKNPEAEAAFVRGLAVTKNVPLEDLCARIMANAADWEPVAAMLTGMRQVMEEVAYLAETVEGVQAIKVAYRV